MRLIVSNTLNTLCASVLLTTAITGCGGSGASGGSNASALPVQGAPLHTASIPIVVDGHPGTITEYPAPFEPIWVAMAPDGNAWFQSHNSVNRITPAGSIASYSTAGIVQYSEFQQMAFGSDGAMWFTAAVSHGTTAGCPEFPAVPSAECTTIGRVTLGGVMTRPIPSIGAFENLPVNIKNQQNVAAAGPNHETWFAFCAGPENGFTNPCGRFRYISVREDGSIDVDGKLPLVDREGNGYFAQSMLEGPDGNMYITGQLNVICPPSTPAVALFQIDSHGRLIRTFDLTSIGGGFMAVGPDGNLWMDSGAGIARVSLSGELIARYPVPDPNTFVNTITAGNDGAMWFTEFNLGKIGRITMDGVITEYAVDPNSGPAGIASLAGEFTGGHGRIWFAEQFASKMAKIEF